MSNSVNQHNAWTSLAELLSRKMNVAALATTIEKEGIYTWDRFGRMIKATTGDANDLYSQARALDLLAVVCKSAVDAQNDIDSGVGHEAMHTLEQFLEDFDSPLVRFGWPPGKCPNFETYKPDHSVPKAVSQAGVADEGSYLGRRERKSLDAIIRALMEKAQMPSEPYAAAKEICDLTSDANGTCEVSRNCVADHIKRIQRERDDDRR